MGDFVKKDSASLRISKIQKTLFESLEAEHATVVRSTNIDHVAIRDFSIFVTAQSDIEVRATILSWQKRNAESVMKQSYQGAVVAEADNYADICYQLHSRDKALAAIIDSVGICTLSPRHSGFEFLADAIISQQLSKKAADTIMRRFRGLFSSARMTPKAFLSLSPDDVLKSGLSKRKYEYIEYLASAIESKQLRLSDLSGKNDEMIRETLKRIKGIGDWTVDMFLLFGLARLDIFPLHDLALRRIIANTYGVKQDDRDGIERTAKRWKPFRSVACWYLYKHENMKAEQRGSATRL